MLLKELHDLTMGRTMVDEILDRYFVSFESIGPMTLRKQSGIKYGIGPISNWTTVMALSDVTTIKLALEADNYKSGSRKKYVGLSAKESSDIEEFATEPTKAKVYYVSYKLDKKCREEIQECVWSSENINKFRRDMIKIGRLYQEKTIDYAKKISALDIIESPMRNVTALSLKHMSVSLAGDKISVALPDENGDGNKIILNDAIHQTRTKFANEYKEYVEETLIPEINQGELPKEMDAQLQRLRYSTDVAAFIEMKQYYKDIVGGYVRVQNQGPDSENDSLDVAKSNFSEDKIRIENMIRMATRYMTPEQRGSYMKYIAGRTKNNVKREDGENRFYLSLCKQEFLKWLISMGLNEIDFAGYRLLGNKGYKSGDVIWFENGQAGRAIIESEYTGWLTIKDVDGVLYGTQSINDLIDVPEADNRIIVKVQQSFVTKYGADIVIKALNRASEVLFKAERNNWTMEMECNDGKTRNIPYDLGKVFFSMFKDMKGKIVKVSKNTVRTQTGMMIDSVYVSIDLSNMPEVVVPAGSVIDMKEDLIDFDIVESDEI